MTALTHLYDIAKEGLVLHVQVQPGGGHDAVVGTHGNALKVRVAAPPVGGKANEHVLMLLSRLFDVPADSLTMTAGESGRSKRIRFAGVDKDEFESRLRVALAEASSGRGPARR